MTRLNAFVPRMSRRAQLGLGAAALVIAGAAGGAGAVSLTQPSIEMAPTVPTAIARLADTRGVVTVKGRIAEVYGDSFVLQDATGRTMVDAGRQGQDSVRSGTAMTVQGRYDDGQMRASYLVDPQGRIAAVGPAGRPPHDRGGPDGPGGPGRNGPPPPPPGGPREMAGTVGSPGAPPPPPGCAVPPPPVGAGTPLPPPGTAALPPVAAPSPARQ